VYEFDVGSLRSAKVMLIGDLMLDIYTVGSVQRISPEAPVPILKVEREQKRPGGAGNAILNLISLGMQVVAIGRVGNDEEGNYLIHSLRKENVDTQGILVDDSFRTPVKKRMIAENQQLLRVDYEHNCLLSAERQAWIFSKLHEFIDAVSVIAISDYAKGFLTHSLLQQTIQMAKEKKIPVIVDPKGIDFSRYQGATVLKPNVSEAIAAAGLGHEASLDCIGQKILREACIETLMVTRSKEGISIFKANETRKDFPVTVHEVKDVTGAGDTVLAVITAALANKIDICTGAKLANVAAGIAIERFGCARISLAALSDRLLEIKTKQRKGGYDCF
jgi:rfaE bifunctional protein kinase chain/domain